MKGKHFAKANWSRTRIVSAVLSVALLFGCITFTTAWLIAENEEGPVVNQFTGSKLQINLSTKGDHTGYKLIPGMTYHLSDDAAPQVKVTDGSVDCYLFAVIHESWGTNSANINSKDQYFTINGINGTNWINLAGASVNDPLESNNSAASVMYCQMGGKNYIDTSNQEKDILILNEFKIPENLTKQQVAPDAFQNGDTPKITVKVYSIQTLGMKDINEAWGYVADAINNNNTKAVVLN